MLPVGHAAVAYLCYTGVLRVGPERVPGDGPVLALLVGSQLPDLVDKPLAWYAGVLPTGRTLAHSLLVLVAVTVAVVVFAGRWNRRASALAFVLGALSHALADALPALWEAETTPRFLLWPLLAVEPPETSPALLELLSDSLTDPYFAVQFGLLVVAAAAWRSHGYPVLRFFTDGGRTDSPTHDR